MARTVDQQHRADLVEAVATSFVHAGTARTSLRDLAADVGASARMLVHHFGSRELLVEAALEVARDRQLAAARAAILPGPDALVALRAAWDWFGEADTRRYFALFSDVAAQERGRPAGERRFSERLAADWQPMFEAVFTADARFATDASELARIVIGVLRGFALDPSSGRAADAHERAYALLVELVAARGSRP